MNDERLDLLISRIVDGEADGQTWEEVTALATAHPAVWREVAVAQRDHAEVQQLVARASAIADTSMLPSASEGDAPAPAKGLPARTPSRAGRTLERRNITWWSWTGWAAAAVLLVYLASGLRPGIPTSRQALTGGVTGGESRAGLVPVASARDAFDEYMTRGRAEGLVLSETPRRVLIEKRPDPEGNGLELIYMQQVMERVVVPNLYQFSGQDEQGRPSLIRYEQPMRGRM